MKLAARYDRWMSNEEIVRQLQQIVATMKRVVDASGELAERVEALERRAGEEVGMLTSLSGHLQVLADQLKDRGEADRDVIQELVDRVTRLEARNP
jgi:hypothetical protein